MNHSSSNSGLMASYSGGYAPPQQNPYVPEPMTASSNPAQKSSPLPNPRSHSNGQVQQSNFEPGQYAHTAPEQSNFHDGFAAGCYSSGMGAIGTCLGFFGSIPCCFCFPNPYRVVGQGTVGLFSRFGRYTRTVEPGLHYANLLTEELRIVDIKMQISDIPRQVAITKDNVSCNIDSVLYWHIVKPYTSVYEVQNVNAALIERTMTTLRSVLGAHELQDAITNRDTLAKEIQDVIAPPAKAWGVKVESILLKDIQFSQELQESFSAAAKQKRIGASKIIAAQAEVESAKLLRAAADILNSPAAMQIRYLDTMKSMAHEAGAKVIFMPPSFSSGLDETSVAAMAKSSSSKSAPHHTDKAAIYDTLSNL